MATLEKWRNSCWVRNFAGKRHQTGIYLHFLGYLHQFLNTLAKLPLSLHVLVWLLLWDQFVHSGLKRSSFSFDYINNDNTLTLSCTFTWMRLPARSTFTTSTLLRRHAMCSAVSPLCKWSNYESMNKVPGVQGSIFRLRTKKKLTISFARLMSISGWETSSFTIFRW